MVTGDCFQALFPRRGEDVREDGGGDDEVRSIGAGTAGDSEEVQGDNNTFGDEACEEILRGGLIFQRGLAVFGTQGGFDQGRCWRGQLLRPRGIEKKAVTYDPGAKVFDGQQRSGVLVPLCGAGGGELLCRGFGGIQGKAFLVAGAELVGRGAASLAF